MTTRPLAPSLRLLAAVALVAVVGCSTGDGTDIDARSPATAAGSDADAADDTDPSSPTPAPVAAETLPGESLTDAPTESFVDATAPPVTEVPETGVPGLDSGDAFCAAWSRFGGSFQVVAVNAAFGEGSVPERAFIEVAAGPTVVGAHAEMSRNWPSALAAEADAALDDAFGPLARRLAAAESALLGEGATPRQIDALRAAWFEFLEGRDPTDAEVVLVLDDELTVLVAAAVPAYLDQVGPWAEDDTLITEVATPLTDEYLATECPDQGTLAGGEVDG